MIFSNFTETLAAEERGSLMFHGFTGSTHMSTAIFVYLYIYVQILIGSAHQETMHSMFAFDRAAFERVSGSTEELIIRGTGLRRKI